MKIAIAFYGFYERGKDSWKTAFPFLEKNFININKHHDIIKVGHSWCELNDDISKQLLLKEYEIGEQIQYCDDLNKDAKKYGYQPYLYNNFKNRARSMQCVVELALKHNPDVIFLTRYDCVIGFPILLDSLKFDKNQIYASNWKQTKNNHIVDHYFIGVAEKIAKFVCIEEVLQQNLFEKSSSYVKWLFSKQLAGVNWVDSHKICAWFMEQQGLSYTHLGYQDYDTCLSRQLSMKGLKIV
jgi:hypothetical protein